jgi:hypothetical protein
VSFTSLCPHRRVLFAESLTSLVSDFLAFHKTLLHDNQFIDENNQHDALQIHITIILPFTRLLNILKRRRLSP